MDVFRPEFQSHFPSDFRIICGMNHISTKLCLDQDLIMHALEGNIAHNPPDLCLTGIYDIQIVG